MKAGLFEGRLARAKAAKERRNARDVLNRERKRDAETRDDACFGRRDRELRERTRGRIRIIVDKPRDGHSRAVVITRDEYQRALEDGGFTMRQLSEDTILRTAFAAYLSGWLGSPGESVRFNVRDSHVTIVWNAP